MSDEDARELAAKLRDVIDERVGHLYKRVPVMDILIDLNDLEGEEKKISKKKAGSIIPQRSYI